MNNTLSIIIPSKNEEFLPQTIEDILKNIRGNTEIIAVLDGWDIPIPKLPEDPRIRILKFEKSIGQRAGTNAAVKLSTSKYICKLDAHVAIDEGFDIKMMAEMQDDWTLIPVMRNLHVFDWVCPDGHRRYQGPDGVCKECGKETHKEIMWIPKTNPQSTSYCFDSEPHFDYFKEYTKTEKYKKDLETGLTETMSIQGSCFMVTGDKYWELNLGDENYGSWGSQGIQVACSTWLSGGKVMVNHKTWYAHCFRTQGGSFGFPYKQSGRQVEKAKKMARELFFDNKWDKQIYPLSWLLERFWPVKGWTEEQLKKLQEWPLQNQKPSKAVLYYTNNRINMRLGKRVREQLKKSGLPITSVSLKPLDFGKNIVYKGKNGYATMFKQILTGLKAMKEDIVYLAESDVFYHPDHFKFTPSQKDKFYYNGNYWFLRLQDGFAIHYNVSPLSGLVAYREALITHFRERVKMIEELGDKYEPLKIGFEPFTHKRIQWKTWYNYEIFMPEGANIDVTHQNNSTWKRWRIEDFRRKPTFWQESTIDVLPGWENLRDLMETKR